MRKRDLKRALALAEKSMGDLIRQRDVARTRIYNWVAGYRREIERLVSIRDDQAHEIADLRTAVDGLNGLYWNAEAHCGDLIDANGELLQRVEALTTIAAFRGKRRDEFRKRAVRAEARLEQAEQQVQALLAEACVLQVECEDQRRCDGDVRSLAAGESETEPIVECPNCGSSGSSIDWKAERFIWLCTECGATWAPGDEKPRLSKVEMPAARVFIDGEQVGDSRSDYDSFLLLGGTVRMTEGDFVEQYEVPREEAVERERNGYRNEDERVDYDECCDAFASEAGCCVQPDKLYGGTD